MWRKHHHDVTMDGLPTTLFGWISFLTLISLGIFTIFDKGLSKRREESEKVSNRLVDYLQTTVNSLDTEMKSLKTQQQENILKLTKVTSENELLTKLVQGRDETTQQFQREGFEAIKRSEEILATVKTTNELVKVANANIEKLYRAIEKHLEHLQKKV